MGISTWHEDANDPVAAKIRAESEKNFKPDPDMVFEPGPNYVSPNSTVHEDAGCPVALNIRAQAGDQTAKRLLTP